MKIGLQPSNPFWLSLETVPGGTALPTTWKQHLGSAFETFAFLFLKSRPDDPAQFVPCPWNCGCCHKVVPQENGTIQGICQCDTKACGAYTLMPGEWIPLELDWSKLAHVLCRAFGLQPKTVKLGLYNTLQIGAWSPDALPVILSLPASPPEFLNTLAVLVARFGRPFILLAPTGRHLGLAAKELLDNIGAACFALEDHLRLGQSGSLVCAVPPAKLFAHVAPLRPEPSAEDIARRTFLVLQDRDQGTRRQPPTLYTVFQLYCVKELTIPQIARKCRCSLGTVANRLKLLQAKTGIAPQGLRQVAPQFVQFNDDVRQAERNHRTRSRD